MFRAMQHKDNCRCETCSAPGYVARRRVVESWFAPQAKGTAQDTARDELDIRIEAAVRRVVAGTTRRVTAGTMAPTSIRRVGVTGRFLREATV